jgi:cation diffusion facilitator CzcD-associated flavoprotein CzcO
MLQRSPTYIVSMPANDKFHTISRKVLPDKVAYSMTRAKNVALHVGMYQLSQAQPGVVRKTIRELTKKQLPDDFEVDVHFKPSYNPWDQRLCLVPNGDLFRAIRHGEASVVTDHIERFDRTGILLTSGKHLDADIIVTATGLNLLVLGGMTLSMDGEPVRLPDTMAYKGMMLSGIPNFALVVGYTNASWTLKADLVCEYVIRLLRHMESSGTRVCVPQHDPTQPEEPFLDFAAGYVLRSVDQFPKQGAKAPWRLKMNYYWDVLLLRHQSIHDDVMIFTNPGSDHVEAVLTQRTA